MRTVDFGRGHGSPYDRGYADAYYRRPIKPHWYPTGTYRGIRIDEDSMTQDQVGEYYAGYQAAEDADDYKDFG